MLSTAIIIFREVLEIAMILGVVLAATRNLPGRLAWIIGGFAGGLFGAAMVAVFAQSISASLSGMGQEFFNAVILFAAAIMIGCTALWMRKHASEMVKHLKQVGHNVTAGTLPHYSLSLIVGLALLREGSEIVLFMYGMALSGQSHASIITGSATGLLLGALVGVLLYYGLLKIPARHMLRVTSWLLILLVAGLASQGVGYLSAAGYFADYSQPLWNTSWLLSEDSIAGKSLHSLIGYTARPSAAQLATYIATLLGLFSAIMVMDRGRKHVVVAAAAIALLACGFKPDSAFALDEIYTPIVEKGEIAVEYSGSRTFDHHAEKNNAQGQSVSLEYAPTDRLVFELAGAYAKEPGNAIKLEDAEVQSRFQFFEQGEYWVDSGLLAAYHIARQNEQPDAVEVKLLLQKDTGNFTHMSNIGFEQHVGHYSGGTGGPDYSFSWNSRYRYNANFQPGIELQSGFGQGPKLGKFNEQEHYIGPAMFGEIIPHLKYQAAYLFGASDAAAQGSARFLLEYELRF